MNKKVEKKGRKSQLLNTNITKAEKEILFFLTQEFLTPNQISIRRKTSNKAVYKIINNLKKKGIINSNYKLVENYKGTIQPFNNAMRLHGQEFNIKILYKDERYKKALEKNSVVYFDGNPVRLYRDSIEVYGFKSFFGDNVQKATSESMAYWTRIFKIIENDLNIIILKNRANNINLVKHKYGECDNELAEKANKEHEKIRIYANEDGKLWFSIDNSFSMHEAHTHHRYTGKRDMEDVVSPFFNDLRDNELVTLSDIKRVIMDLASQNKETAAGLGAITEFLRSQLPKNDEDKNKLVEVEKSRFDYVG